MTDNKLNLHNLLILGRAHITTRLHWKLTKHEGLLNPFNPGWQTTSVHSNGPSTMPLDQVPGATTFMAKSMNMALRPLNINQFKPIHPGGSLRLINHFSVQNSITLMKPQHAQGYRCELTFATRQGLRLATHYWVILHSIYYTSENIFKNPTHAYQWKTLNACSKNKRGFMCITCLEENSLNTQYTHNNHKQRNPLHNLNKTIIAI